MTSMNNDPALNAGNSIEAQRGFGRRMALVAISASALLSSCALFDNENDSSAELVIPKSDIEGLCADEATPLSDYRAEFGSPGPFAPSEAILAEQVDNDEVVKEAVTENAQNTLGLSYMKTLMEQNDASYQVSNFFSEANTTFDTALADSEAQKALCASVVEALLTEGEVGDVVATSVVRATNVYDESGRLIDVNIDEDADVQKPIKMLFIRNANGAPTGGIVLDADRNGEFVLIRNIGDQTAQATPDSSPETTVVNPEVDVNGNPIPVTPTEEEPVFTIPAEGTTPAEAPSNGGGTDTGSGNNGNNGNTGQPGEGGECNGEEPTPNCEGTGPGPGGPGETPEEPTPEEPTPEEPETPASTTTLAPPTTPPVTTIPAPTTTLAPPTTPPVTTIPAPTTTTIKPKDPPSTPTTAAPPRGY